MSGQRACPGCVWVMENNELVCMTACYRAACEPCATGRWRRGRPAWDAVANAYAADAAAQEAEERGYPDWREYAAEARAAWAHAEELLSREDRHER